MPIVNPRNAKSNLDYTGPVQPDMNYGTRVAEKAGSADTFLSRAGLFGYGGGSYDRYYNPWLDQADQRYANESNTQALGNGLLRLGLKTAAGIPQLVGGISSLAASPFVVANGGSFQSAFELNPLNQFNEWATTVIDENTPQMYSSDFNNRTFGEQLQSPGQLLAESVDSLAFVAQSILGGGILSKLGTGAKMLSKFSTMNSLESILAGAAPKNLISKANKIDSLISHSFLSTSEAALEAAEMKKEIKKDLLNQVVEGKLNYTDEQIEELADARAKNVFWLNMGILSVTNIPFNKLVTGSLKTPLKSSANELGLRLIGDKFEANTLSGINRLVNSKTDFVPVFARQLIANTVSEGLEESLQYSIQKINKLQAGSSDTVDVSKRMLSELNPFNENGFVRGIFNDDERMKAAGLGAIIGGASPVFTAKSTYKDLTNQVAYRDKVIKDLNSSYSDLLSANVYDKEEDVEVELKTEEKEGQKYYNQTIGTTTTPISEEEYMAQVQQYGLSPEGGKFIRKGNFIVRDGKPVVSSSKVAEAIADMQYHAEIDHMMEVESLKQKTDETKLALLKGMKLSRLAKTAFDAGVGDLLVERFETALEDETPEQTMGSSNSEIKGFIEDVKLMRNVYDNATSDALSTFSDFETNKKRVNALYDLGTRAVMYDRFAKENSKEAENLLMGIKSDLPMERSQDVDDAHRLMTSVAYNQATLEDLLFSYDDVVRRGISADVAKQKAKLEKEIEDTVDKTNAEKAELKKIANIFSSIDSTKVEKLTETSLKARQLAEAHQEVVKAYNDTRSLKAFKKDKNTALTKTSKQPSQIQFNAGMSTKIYDAFEDRELRRLEFRDKHETAKKAFMSEVMSAFISDFNSKTDVVDKAQALAGLLKEISDRKPALYDNQVELLRHAHASLVGFYKEQESLAEEQGQILEYIDEEFATDEQLDAIAVKDTLGSFMDPNKVDEILNAPRIGEGFKTRGELLNELLSNISKPAEYIVEQFNETPEEYEDIASLQFEISKLEHAIRVLSPKEGAAYEKAVDRMKTLLEDLENVVKPQVVKNLGNKEIKNQKQNRLYGTAFQTLISHPAFRALHAADTKVAELDALSTEDPYVAQLAFLEAVHAMDKGKLQQAIQTRAAEIQGALDNLKLELPEHIRNLFITSPSRAFQWIITEKLSKSILRKTEDPLTTKFSKDYDLVELLQSVDPTSELGAVATLYLQAYALEDVRKASRSSLSSTNIVSAIKKFVSDQKTAGKPAPSVAQERVVTQIVRFLTSPLDKPVVGNNIVALKAPPGAGKSLIVIPAALSVAGITPDKVATTAPLDAAAKNIQASTNSKQPARSFKEMIEALDTDQIPTTVKAIVVDEATASTFQELSALFAAHTRYLNRNPEASSKLILIYDPNQITTSNFSVPEFARTGYAVPTVVGTSQGLSPENLAILQELQKKDPSKKGFTLDDYEKGIAISTGEFKFSYVQNVYDIIPLAVTYRSDVPQVVSLQKEFLKDTEVTKVVTSASSDPRSSTKDLKGTFAESSTTSLGQILKASIATNPNRTRVIIVATEKDKARYSEFSPSVEIFTAREAAGITRDEVYVDIKPSDQPSYGKPVIYNQAIYTATSRAKAFVYLGNTHSDFTVDNDIEAKIKANEGYKEARHDTSTIEKEAQIKVINNIVTPKSPIKVGKTEETKVTEEAVLGDVNAPVDNATTISEEGILEEDEPVEGHSIEEEGDPILASFDAPKKHTHGFTTVLHPNNEVMKSVSPDEPLYLVRDESNDQVRYVILKEINNGYQDVGILSKEDVQMHHQNGGSLFMEGVKLIKDKRASNTWQIQGDFQNNHQVVYMTPNSNTVKFVYDNTESEDFDSGYSALLHKVLRELYPEGGISNLHEIQADPSKFVSFRIYTSTEQRAQDFPSNYENPPRLSRPYMVIKGVKLENGGNLKPIFVELEAAQLKKNEQWQRLSRSSASDTSDNKLDTLLSKLSTFQNMLGNISLPGAYNKLAPGVGFESNGSVYYPFHKFITMLSEAHQKTSSGTKVDQIVVATDEYNRLMPGFQLPPITTGDVQSLLQIAFEIDVLIHGDGALLGNTRRFNGKAQYVVDRVAATNFVASHRKGVTILRSTRPVMRDGKVKDVITGVPLLGPVNFEETSKTSLRPAGKSKNPAVTELLKEAVRQKITRRPDWAAIPAFSQMLSDGPVHVAPLTLDELNEIFGQSSFSHLNEGFGLKVPIYLDEFSVRSSISANDVNLKGQVVSKLRRVQPTRLGIASEQGYDELSPVDTSRTEDTTPTIGDVYQHARESILGKKEPNFEQFPSELVGQFIAEQNTDDIEEALENYSTALDKSGVFKTASNSFIAKLTKVLSAKGLGSTLRTRLLSVLQESVDVEDYSGFAGRDFVKASITAILTGRHNDTKFWRKIAQFYHNPANKKDVSRFATVISAYTTLEEFKEAVEAVNSDLEAIAKAYNLKFDPPKVETTDDYLGYVAYISKEFSSQWRAALKTTKNDLPNFDTSAPAVAQQADNFIQDLGNIVFESDWTAFKEKYSTSKLYKDLEAFAAKAGLTLDEFNIDLVDSFISAAEKELTYRHRIPFSETDPIANEEAKALYNKFFRKSALRRLLDIFKSKNGSEDYQIVSKAWLEFNMGKSNWGLFKNGIVYTVGVNGETGSKVLRHEVFHKIFNQYLSKSEREIALELGRERYGISDSLDIEERLADEFAMFAKSKKGILGRIRSIFRKILRFFNFTYNNLNSIEDLFDSMEDGNFGRPLTESSEERDLNILKIFGSVENYSFAKESLLDLFDEVQQESREGSKIMSFEEVVGETFDRMRKILYDPSMNVNMDYDHLQLLKTAFGPILSTPVNTKEIIKYFFGNIEATAAIQAKNEVAKEEMDRLIAELAIMTEEQALQFEEDYGYQATQYLEELKQARSAADLFNETYDSETIDPETKVTGLVKQRLLAIKYGTRTNTQRAQMNKVYATLLPLLSQIDTSSMDNVINSVYDRIKFLVKDEILSGLQPNVRKATAAFLQSSLFKLSEVIDNKPSDITFYKDINHTSEYVIISKDGKTYSQIQEEIRTNGKSDSTIFYYESSDLTLDNFAKRIARESGTPYEELKKSFDYYEETAFMRDLVTAISSLRESRIGVGIVEYKEGAYTSKYIQSKNSGSKAVIESDIVDGFITMFEKAQNRKETTLGLTALANRIKEADTPEKKFEITKAILNRFGIKNFTKDSSDDTKISNFLDKFQSVVGELEVAYKTDKDPREVMENESSFIARAVELREGEGDFVQNLSYIRGDGQRAYSWIDASFQSSVLNFLRNSLKGLKGIGFNHIQGAVKGVVKSNAALYKHNIFVNGRSSIGSEVYVDHDSMKIKGREDFATFLHGEGSADYFKRMFDFGFLSQVKSRAGYYLQYLPIPSNRRTITGVEVKALNVEKVREAIKDTVRSQVDRPAASEFKSGVYAKRRNLLTLPGVDGRVIPEFTSLQEKNAFIDATAKEIIDFITARTEEAYPQIKNLLSTTKENSPRNWKMDMKNLTWTAEHFGLVEKIQPESEFRSKISKLNNSIGTPQEEEAMEQMNRLLAEREVLIDDMIKKTLNLFALNHAVNQYALAQILYGDEAFYKSKEDQTKRIQVFTATGDTLITDTKHGFNPTSRLGILNDIEHAMPADLKFIRDEAFRESNNETDGFGFMLPEVYERLAFSRGPSAQDDVALKPVYAGIDKNGEPLCVKYAVIVLTDSQVYNKDGSIKSRYLYNLRKEMRRKNLDQAVFASSVKVGLPNNKLIGNFDLDSGEVSFNEDGVLTMDNRYFRFQLNPASDVDKDVTNLSQGTAFPDTNGQNPEEAYQIHQLNSIIMELGDKLLNRKLGLSRKGKTTKASQDVLRKAAIRATSGMANKEDLNAMLSAKTAGRYAISMNLPIMADQLISTLSSIFSKSTVNFKFAGSKLSLQSEFGSYNAVELKLKYKDAEGYTEVFLPEAYREFFQEGDKIVSDSIVGFRIPSSNYHSLLALKVKGFYEVPPGSTGNVVIVPSLVTYYHGSDYDIDSLFVIRKEGAPSDIDLNSIASKYMPEHTYSETLNVMEGDYLGAHEDIQTVGKIKIANYLSDLADIIEDRLTEARNNQATNLFEIEADLQQVAKMGMLAAKNAIVHTFSSNLRAEKNRRDLLTPISFARVSSTRARLFNDLEQNLKEGLLEDLMAAGIQDLEGKTTEEIVQILEENRNIEIANKTLNRFIPNEDTVIEMVARLEAERRGIDFSTLSDSEVAALVNPRGSMWDLYTQSIIHYNTYSGVKLTGVSANTGKTLAYIHSASKITKIRRVSDGKIYGLSGNGLRDLLNEAKMGSLNELLYRTNEYEIEEREDPKLKPGSGMKVNGVKFESLSKNERNYDGSLRTAYTDIDGNKVPISVFETIDTIINLAIDNVKEMKLFVLGITNSNANAYLSTLALGIPLNDVALIFKSPAVAKASAGSKFEPAISYATIMKDLKENYVAEEVLQAVASINRKGNSSGTLEANVESLGINTTLLRRDYLGELTEIQSKLVAAATFYQLKSAASLGEELFEYAQLFSLLRGMPSDKTDLDNRVDGVKKYVNFDSSVESTGYNQDATVYAVLEELAQQRMDKYPELNKDTLKQILMPEATRLVRANFMNRLIERSVAKSFKPSDNSVFESLTPLNVPNVFTAWTEAIKLQNLIEDTFIVHSPVVKDFARKIITRLNINDSTKATETNETVQKEFIKFLVSGTTVEVDGRSIEADVKDQKSVSVTNSRYSTTLYGADAWSHEFALRLKEIRKDVIKTGNNELLKNLMIDKDYRGMYKIKLTADKTSNPETLALLREGFDQLVHSEFADVRDMAYDLYKYAISSQGLYYSRTGLALIFPIRFSIAFSNAFNVAIDNVIKRDEGGQVNLLQTEAILDRLAPVFAYQFARNNPQLIPTRRGPVKSGTYASKDGESRALYMGTHPAVGFYDMKFKQAPNPPKYITNYSKEVFVFIATVEGFDYYKRFASKSNLSFYKMPEDFIRTTMFDVKKFKTPQIRVSAAYDSTSNYFELLHEIPGVKVGQEVLIHNFSSALPSASKNVEVTSINKIEGKYRYQYRETGYTSYSTQITTEEYLNLNKIYSGSDYKKVIDVISNQRDARKMLKRVKTALNVETMYHTMRLHKNANGFIYLQAPKAGQPVSNPSSFSIATLESGEVILFNIPTTNIDVPGMSHKFVAMSIETASKLSKSNYTFEELKEELDNILNENC